MRVTFARLFAFSLLPLAALFAACAEGTPRAVDPTVVRDATVSALDRKAEDAAAGALLDGAIFDATISDAGTDGSLRDAAAPRLELPRGGTEFFPTYRLVGYCGTPGGPALGPLLGDLGAKTKKMMKQAEPYAEGRKIMPVFELIAVIVMSTPGQDQKYRRRISTSVVDDYLKAAREAKGILLLNIQPGKADFLGEIQHFEKYLRMPDVGVAIDPEWSVRGKQTPGVYYGQTTGAIINTLAAYLSKLVQENNLPEKALVFHQLNRHVVKDENVIVPPPGVAIIKSVDGLGPKGSKLVTYKDLMKLRTPGVHPGFKLFFDEDTKNGGRLMTAKEVLALQPEPEYVMYE